MAEPQEDFWTPEVTRDFNFVNHNDTDYSGFREFAKEIDERYSTIEARREKAERVAALERWDRELPARWQDAKLSLIGKPVVQKILAAFKENPRGSFFFRGESGAGKTFVAYAVIRRFLGTGVATPSQVKQVSEAMLLGWVTQGFRGADLFGKIFSEQYKLYFFDGIGSLSDQEAAKVSGSWESLIDHIYTNDLVAVFTSTDSLDRFVETLSPSGETKLRTLIGGRNLAVESAGSIARKKKPEGSQ